MIALGFETTPAAERLIIAVDFDGTWTADPTLWRAFYDFLSLRGHVMIIATGRTQPKTEEEKERWREERARQQLPSGVEVIYCGSRFKEEALRAAGWNVNVWIDDMPGMIQECRLLGDTARDKEL